MNILLKSAGALLAIVGVLVCLAAGALRLMGHSSLAGYEPMTLFITGIGLMVAACVVKLYLPSSR